MHSHVQTGHLVLGERKLASDVALFPRRLRLAVLWPGSGVTRHAPEIARIQDRVDSHGSQRRDRGGS